LELLLQKVQLKQALQLLHLKLMLKFLVLLHRRDSLLKQMVRLLISPQMALIILVMMKTLQIILVGFETNSLF